MKFSSTEHPISWFRDRYREGSLVIKPPYQRKPVWADRQKSSLIESVLMQLPVPEVFIQQSTTSDGETTYAVVDGQQRIRTFLQFVGAELDPQELEHNKFVLDKVGPNSPWRNMGFTDLADQERKAFFGYSLAVRYLVTDNDDEIRDMFRRLNQFLSPLNAQELRNAVYTGPFVTTVTRLADDSYWAQTGIISAASIRRMIDIQFVSELLIGVMHGPQGGSPKIVDAYYAQYEDYDDEFPGQKQSILLYDRTLALVKILMPDLDGTRWANATDFYSLFVALAHVLRTKVLRPAEHHKARAELLEFGSRVDARMSDPKAKVALNVRNYVEAVQKGANEKARRAARHTALLSIIDSFLSS